MNLQAWSLLGFESDHHHENKNKKHKQFVLQVNNECKPMLVYDNWKAQLHHKKIINT